MMFNARVVHVGDVIIGGYSPVVVQSMTNTATDDVVSTTRQIVDLVNAGSKLVRLSVRNTKDVKALYVINEELRQKKVRVPLVADIHFSHELAMLSSALVQKVRVNPGNFFILKAKNEFYSESDYEKELEAIEEKFGQLIEACRKNGTAIRIGINGGSLPSRVLQRFGHTPLAMVQATVEFVSIAHRQNFHQVVVSIKDSSVLKTIEANRLLVKELVKMGYDYPIHLGVTEAGSDQEGIIKSSIGIGTLLAEGIGNTIRVSLTGSPVKEIPVAYKIIEASQKNFVSQDINLKYFDLVPPAVLPEVNLLDKQVSHASEVNSLKDIRQLLVENSHPEIVKIGSDLEDETELSIVLGEILMKYPIKLIVDERKYLTEFYRTLFQITERKISGANFVSCPSCGRTSFDIERITKQVKETFSSYRGLTFAVMGCVVNGPGEISHADYGIIGAKPGYVHLYVHGKMVMKNIPEPEAVNMLKKIVDADLQNHSS